MVELVIPLVLKNCIIRIIAKSQKMPKSINSLKLLIRKRNTKERLQILLLLESSNWYSKPVKQLLIHLIKSTINMVSSTPPKGARVPSAPSRLLRAIISLLMGYSLLTLLTWHLEPKLLLKLMSKGIKEKCSTTPSPGSLLYEDLTKFPVLSSVCKTATMLSCMFMISLVIQALKIAMTHSLC